MRRAVCTGVTCAAVCIGAMVLALPRVLAPSETGAGKAITTIHTAQVQYYSSYNRFAASLQELGSPASGADGPTAAGLIDRDLAGGEKSGFRFTLSPSPAGYMIDAQPLHSGAGRRSYFFGPDMKIHYHLGGPPATPADPIVGE